MPPFPARTAVAVLGGCDMQRDTAGPNGEFLSPEIQSWGHLLIVPWRTPACLSLACTAHSRG